MEYKKRDNASGATFRIPNLTVHLHFVKLLLLTIDRFQSTLKFSLRFSFVSFISIKSNRFSFSTTKFLNLSKRTFNP